LKAHVGKEGERGEKKTNFFKGEDGARIGSEGGGGEDARVLQSKNRKESHPNQKKNNLLRNSNKPFSREA